MSEASSALRVGELTVGETLLLARRRKGLGQRRMSRAFKITYDLYSRWERDLVPGAPRQLLWGLQPHEVCLIRRRRAGLTQQAVADKLGLCRFWINRMEQGTAPVRDLAEFWACSK